MSSFPTPSAKLFSATREEDVPLNFDAVYARWFRPVTRWARALGCADGEIDDVAQDVFVIVQRKLADFDGENLPSWLYRITARTTRDHRRRAWFRRVIFGGEPRRLAAIPSAALDPSAVFERKQRQEILDRLLARLGEKPRVVFVLFEIEGVSGEEIAELLDIPLATVWSRLHFARRTLMKMAAQHESGGSL
jgi:RNA polymerase sigma-70 factor (ECF subfamily)